VAARARRQAVPPLLPQLGDAHAVLRAARRAEGLARGQGGGHRGDPG
jgi:hypothetical protein